ncbi:sensor histidine kinase [Streptococcus dentapri]|uniref:histidine kinase n=1 Tax=Streptococcus dentapri TaxID=573564 RepID=A0ABV8D351_9STRE
MLNKLKQGLFSEGFSTFAHFLSIFTIIFAVMTILILQIMQIGVYSSVDDSINKAADNADSYIYMNMYKASFYSAFDERDAADISIFTDGDDFLGNGGTIDAPMNDTNNSAANKSHVEANGTIETVLYDHNGKILNSSEVFSGLSKLKMDKNLLNKINKISLSGNFQEQEHYRYKTIAVKDENFPKVAYVTIAISVNQLNAVNHRYRIIIISVMAVFWILSIFASVYLANWSRKPILAAYEKQKNFVEDASHELRTPLTVLQNRLESLFRKPDETILDNYETIASSLEEVRNMRILTTNLLNLARRDDKLKPEIEEIGSDFFDTIFENYEMIAVENGKVFTFSNETNGSIRSDKTLIKQLMTILFDNAVKYTNQDGAIDIKVLTKDKRLSIIVSDNGSGISDEDKVKIFDRFYRIDKARTRQTGGFGLGLSLAKQIVEALKGTITVRDNQPNGTVFDIKINI